MARVAADIPLRGGLHLVGQLERTAPPHYVKGMPQKVGQPPHIVPTPRATSKRATASSSLSESLRGV